MDGDMQRRDDEHDARVSRETAERRARYREQFESLRRLMFDHDPAATSGDHSPDVYEYAVERVFDSLTFGKHTVAEVQDVIERKFLFPLDPQIGHSDSPYGVIAREYWERWHSWLCKQAETTDRRRWEYDQRRKQALHVLKEAIVAGTYACPMCGRGIAPREDWCVTNETHDEHTGECRLTIWHARCDNNPEPFPRSMNDERTVAYVLARRAKIAAGEYRCSMCGEALSGGAVGATRLGVMKLYCHRCSQESYSASSA